MVRIVVSLTGMPSRLISRSDGRPPAAMAEQPDDSRQAGSPARERRCKTRNALGEDAPIALLVSTPPAPEAGTDDDRRSLSG
jgi:hypothetical protein